MSRRRASRSRPVSSLDVARRAGVSRTTVSFVLNNAPGKSIPEATRARVLAAARELAYVPNARARSIALVRHRTIGFFIPHAGYVSSDAYVHRIIQGMSPVLNKSRFRLVVQALAVDQRNYLQVARQDEVDGVVFMNAHGGDRGLQELIDAGLPLVAIGTLADKRVTQLDIDNRLAAAEAVRYLVGLGHRDIGMVVHASLSYLAARDRLAGFRAAMAAARLPVRKEWIRVADLTEQSGYRAMGEILASRRRPTAVFASNDVVAYGALKSLQERGFAVPGDVSLMGFDDDLLSRFLKPQLTTVYNPAASIGAEAARLLIGLVRGTPMPPHARLRTSLVVRESCGRIG
ncbi:MAG TPA: LacI family DNA-binding transcriptional regulator [Anaeromyxobacter sp.]|nr:LacI family DNA-binding transcriptional regulator [Anaeromyxobacter sp.]